MSSAAPTEAKQPETGKGSHAQILKSAALIGGSTAISVGMKFVRTKIVALMLGPAGIGLLGIYQSVSDFTRSAVGLGVSASGVRQIAEAVATNDSGRIAATVVTLRWVTRALGVIGALFLLVFHRQVAQFTFGVDQHQKSIMLLSVAVLLTVIADSQLAVLQGMRQIRSMAFVNVFGAACGALVSAPLIYFWGEHGVAPAIVAGAVCAAGASWWKARKIEFQNVSLTLAQGWTEFRELATLGVVLLSSSLMATGAAYLIRSIISRCLGVGAAGQFQAAWSVAGQYVNFILQAMAVDFYPRLTAVEKDHPQCNRLINEQVEVGILLAGPGILATLTFAPLVIQLLYSAKFGPAMELLRWNGVAMLFRVAAWPMGYLIVTQNKRRIFLLTSLLVQLCNLGLVWFLTPRLGLKAAGIAVLISSMFDFLLMNAVAMHITGFKWSVTNIKLALLFVPLAVGFFVGSYFLPHWVLLLLGTLATVITGIGSLRILVSFVPIHRFPKPIRRMLSLLRMIPPD